MTTEIFDTVGQHSLDVSDGDVARVEISGAGGSAGDDGVEEGGDGGPGGYVEGLVDVSGVSTLDIYVAEGGSTTGGEAAWGYYDGGEYQTGTSGGGGAGHSVVVAGGDIQVEAAGGGGGGSGPYESGTSNNGGWGGAGGADGGSGGDGGDDPDGTDRPGPDAEGSGHLGGNGGDGGDYGGSFGDENGDPGGSGNGEAGGPLVIETIETQSGGGEAGGNFGSDAEIEIEYYEVPSAPANASATADGGDIVLEWDDPAETFDTVEIHRSETAGVDTDGEPIATVGPGMESYSDTVGEGRERHYRLVAWNEFAASEDSDEVSAQTELPAPSEFVIVDARATELDLEWTLNSTTEDGVLLYRRYDSTESEFTEVADLDPGTESHTLEGVHNGRDVTLYATVYVEDEESDASNEDSATTPLPDVEAVALDVDTHDQIAVSGFDANLNHGDYRIRWRRSVDSDWADETTVDHDAEPLEHVISPVLGGEEYDVDVRSETEDVTGAWHRATDITHLEPASGVTLSDVDETSMDATWTVESDFEGEQKVWLARTDWDYANDPGRLIGTVDETTEEFAIDGLHPEREYAVVIRALTQYVHADSDAETATTESIGLEQRSVPPSGPYAEVDHPDGGVRKLDAIDIQRKPTVNGYPRVEIDVPYDETWHSPAFDDAPIRVWIDGDRQPIDVLEHRDLDPEDTSLKARGGTELDQRVVERTGIIPAAEFVEYLISEYTDLEPVVDSPEQQIREDVLLQLGETLAELQAAFIEIPADVPLRWTDDDGLEALQTAFLVEAEDTSGQSTVSDDEYSGGEASVFVSDADSLSFTVDLDYEMAEPMVVFREEQVGDSVDVNIYVDGTLVGGTTGSSGLNWGDSDVDDPLGPGEHTIEFDAVGTVGDSPEVHFDVVGIVDDRFDYTFDNDVHEPGGFLDGPEPIPDTVRLELEQIDTPLAVAQATLSVTTDDGDGIELGLREDGTGDYISESGVLETTLEYDELEATVQGRVGLGRRDGLDPRDETPRTGYESRVLESLELRADLDETPVLIDRTFDAQLIDILREVVPDIYDGAFEIRPGEFHMARIDGRPSDVDPDLIGWSVDRSTEGTVDRAIVYAASQSLRRMAFSATQDEWTDLPLGEGRIVEGSATVYDAADDDETLERGDDYELREVVIDGPPEIRLLTSVSEPRLDCDFKPRGEHERADLPDAVKETVQDATHLNSQQMADLAAFQAVEGSYTDVVIDASVTVPIDEVGWNVIDALNVAGLPGDQPYQINDEDSDPTQGQFRLGAGMTGEEKIQDLDDETGRLSRRV